MEGLTDLFCQHEIRYIQNSKCLPKALPYQDGVFYTIRENLSTVSMAGRYVNIDTKDFLITPTTEGEIKMKGGTSEFVKKWIFMKVE